MPKKEKQNYQVETVTYLKVPTGELYPEDYPYANVRGKKKYNAKVLDSKKVVNTTWGDIKKKAYEESVGNKNVNVTWRKPAVQIQKIVRKHPDGVQEITYFNPVKK